jgi:hypothetical protein
MSDGNLQIALLIVVIAFVLLVAVRGALPAMRVRRERAPVRLSISRSVSVGSDERRPKEERARALVEAGRAALTKLEKPRLAAHHAEWAHEILPADADVVELAITALSASRGYARLERLLWTSLDASEDPALRARVVDALGSLYEGPMRRPERARALRRLAKKD